MQRWCYKVGQLRISKIKSVLVIHQTIILLGFFFNLQALKKFENLNIIVSINILGKWTNKRIINLADIFFSRFRWKKAPYAYLWLQVFSKDWRGQIHQHNKLYFSSVCGFFLRAVWNTYLHKTDLQINMFGIWFI